MNNKMISMKCGETFKRRTRISKGNGRHHTIMKYKEFIFIIQLYICFIFQRNTMGFVSISFITRTGTINMLEGASKRKSTKFRNNLEAVSMANEKETFKIRLQKKKKKTKIKTSEIKDTCLLNEDLNQSTLALTRSSFLSLAIASSVAAITTKTSKSNAMVPPNQVDSFDCSRGVNQRPLSTSISMSSTGSSNSLAAGDTLIETISGFVSGGALSTTKTIVKYPLDTATVRLQMTNTPYSIQRLDELFKGSFDGISSPLISNIPGGAVFFAVKDAVKSSLRDSGMPKWMSTSIAVGVANFPYWFIRNPSEVIKTRQQARVEGYGEGVTVIDAFRNAMNNTNGETIGGGFNELYTGYLENIIYAFPADVIKFIVYEQLSGGKKNLQPAKGAAYGAFATAVAQGLTTPLDVVRNRIMAADGGPSEDEEMNNYKKNSSKKHELTYLESLQQIAETEGLPGLFAGLTPRIGKSILSGAIQFATYEDTKQKIRRMFEPK